MSKKNVVAAVVVEANPNRVHVTHENVQMDILGDIRPIQSVKVSYTKSGDGKVQRCMSFQEYGRIADEVHRMLRAKRRVYSERE